MTAEETYQLELRQPS